MRVAALERQEELLGGKYKGTDATFFSHNHYGTRCLISLPESILAGNDITGDDCVDDCVRVCPRSQLLEFETNIRLDNVACLCMFALIQ